MCASVAKFGIRARFATGSGSPVAGSISAGGTTLSDTIIVAVSDQEKKKPGPDPERLVIDEDAEEALARLLKKNKLDKERRKDEDSEESESR